MHWCGEGGTVYIKRNGGTGDHTERKLGKERTLKIKETLRTQEKLGTLGTGGQWGGYIWNVKRVQYRSPLGYLLPDPDV